MGVAKCSIIRVAILGLLMQRYQQRVGGLLAIIPIAYKFHSLSRGVTVGACCMLASGTLSLCCLSGVAGCIEHQKISIISRAAALAATDKA